jgi:hypothetical protein
MFRPPDHLLKKKINQPMAETSSCPVDYFKMVKVHNGAAHAKTGFWALEASIEYHITPLKLSGLTGKMFQSFFHHSFFP